MKVFISYSVYDTEQVKQVVDYLAPHVEDIKWWNKSNEPGKNCWESIFGWIDNSDLVLAVITDKAVKRAMAMGQEIGHAKAKSKKIIPLVGTNVDTGQLGCLQGITHIPFNDKDIADSMLKLKDSVIKIKSQDEKGAMIFWAALVGIVALLFLAKE